MLLNMTRIPFRACNWALIAKKCVFDLRFVNRFKHSDVAHLICTTNLDKMPTPQDICFFDDANSNIFILFFIKRKIIGLNFDYRYNTIQNTWLIELRGS